MKSLLASPIARSLLLHLSHLVFLFGSSLVLRDGFKSEDGPITFSAAGINHKYKTVLIYTPRIDTDFLWVPCVQTLMALYTITPIKVKGV